MKGRIAVVTETKLYSLLLTQRDLCTELLELSQLQVELIDRNDFMGLFNIINSKQQLIARWERLRQGYPDLNEIWRALRIRMTAAEQWKYNKVISEVEALYSSLLEQERTSTDLLTVSRDESQRQLNDISQGASVHYAYREEESSSTQRLLDVDQ